MHNNYESHLKVVSKKSRISNNQQKNPISKDPDNQSEHIEQASITQLNAHSRTNETGQLIATESDMLNALQLLQPIDIKSMQTHERLLHYFKSQPFTYLDAQVRLRISETTLKRDSRRSLPERRSPNWKKNP